MARLLDFYKNTVVQELTQKFGYKSNMEVPRITKITLNMGVGETVADKKVLEHAVGDMVKIAGQKPAEGPAEGPGTGGATRRQGRHRHRFRAVGRGHVRRHGLERWLRG